MKARKPLKRTPLARGDSQMRRTGRIPQRRTRHRDTDESLSLRSQYRTTNPVCEITGFLRRIGRPSGGKYDIPSIEIHHICGGAGRYDFISNMIALCPTWHRFVEDNAIAGRVLCLVIKSRKTPPEVDADEFLRCSGMHLAGWLSMDKVVDACPGWLQPYRLMLIESLL